LSKNFCTNPGNNFRRGKNNRFFKPNEYQAVSQNQQPGYKNYRNSEVRTRNNGIQLNQNNTLPIEIMSKIPRLILQQLIRAIVN
jgi:hypothetical protein